MNKPSKSSPWKPTDTPEGNGQVARQEIGVITKGSLTEGVEMKLNPDQSVEDVKAGKFVVIEGFKNEFNLEHLTIPNKFIGHLSPNAHQVKSACYFCDIARG